MAFNIQFKPIVYQDIDKATEWYEAGSKGLGKRFTQMVYLSFDNIIQHPTHYKEISAGIRKHKVKRFPYFILFSIKEQKIIVLGVVHNRRSKHFFRRRLM